LSILNYLILKYAAELGTLIDEHRFRCFYQPIVSLSSGGVMGWEGLLRGPEDHYLHSPDNIFRIAEGTQCLVELETMSHQMAAPQTGTPDSLFNSNSIDIPRRISYTSIQEIVWPGDKEIVR